MTSLLYELSWCIYSIVVLLQEVLNPLSASNALLKTCATAQIYWHTLAINSPTGNGAVPARRHETKYSSAGLRPFQLTAPKVSRLLSLKMLKA